MIRPRSYCDSMKCSLFSERTQIKGTLSGFCVLGQFTFFRLKGLRIIIWILRKICIHTFTSVPSVILRLILSQNYIKFSSFVLRIMSTSPKASQSAGFSIWLRMSGVCYWDQYMAIGIFVLRVAVCYFSSSLLYWDSFMQWKGFYAYFSNNQSKNY